MGDPSNLTLNGYYDPNRSVELRQWLRVFQAKHTSPLEMWEKQPALSETREGARRIAIAVFAFGVVIGFSASLILYGGNALSLYFTGHLISNLEVGTMLGVGCMIVGVVAYIRDTYWTEFWKDPAFCQEKREAEIERLLAHKYSWWEQQPAPSNLSFEFKCLRFKEHLDEASQQPNEAIARGSMASEERSVCCKDSQNAFEDQTLKLKTQVSTAPRLLVAPGEQILMCRQALGWTLPQATFTMSKRQFLAQDNSHLTFSDFFDMYGWSFTDRLSLFDPSIQRILANSLAADFENLGFEGCINKYRDIYSDHSRLTNLLSLMCRLEPEHREKVQKAFLSYLTQNEYSSSCQYHADLAGPFGDLLLSADIYPGFRLGLSRFQIEVIQQTQQENAIAISELEANRSAREQIPPGQRTRTETEGWPLARATKEVGTEKIEREWIALLKKYSLLR